MLTFSYSMRLAESKVSRCWCCKKTGNTISKFELLISMCENVCAKSYSALKKIAEHSDGRTYLEPSASDRADHSSSNSCCFVLQVNICCKVLFSAMYIQYVLYGTLLSCYCCLVSSVTRNIEALFGTSAFPKSKYTNTIVFIASKHLEVFNTSVFFLNRSIL
jgi:hypothetical protein